MIVTESAMESVFSKARVKLSKASYKHMSFTKNGSDGVCAGICFW